MFSDSNAENRQTVHIKSDWKRVKKTSHNGCQTSQRKLLDQESQVAFYQDAEIQTINPQTNGKAPKDPMTDPKFFKFIAKAVPLLEAELEAAARSRAFDGYQLLDAEMDDQVRKLHTLDAAMTRTQNEGLKVSWITWSPTGSIIGVCFEAEDHQDWCDHPSSLHIWNLNRRDFDPGNAYKVLQAPACLTSAEFHPQESGLIAAGGHSGEVHVWNAWNTDPLIASSGVGSIHGHRDKITSVQWINGSHFEARTSFNTYFILSTGLDGVLILWTLDQSKNDLNPIRKMIIDPSYLPKKQIRKKTDVGITCLSVNSNDNSVVVIGTESGSIFEGSLNSPSVIHGPDENPGEWYDPIKIPFAPHFGRVNQVKCSPFDRNIFLSCGSDQEVRIYSLLHPYAPIQVIPMEETSGKSLAWSLSRPLVFAVGCQNHKLLIYDLRTSKDLSKALTLPLELKASEKLIPFPLTSVAFNGINQGLIATGDGFGRVHVWKLTSKLMSKNPDEIQILNNIGDTKED